MELELIRHPSTQADDIESIRVDVQRQSAWRLALTYHVVGDIGSLIVPGIVPPERADGLWQRTCFEAFLKRPESEGYAEFNFSPSTQWAAYLFDGYRAGRRDLDSAAVLRSDIRAGGGTFNLGVVFEMGEAAKDGVLAPELLLGLSAVLEMRDRTRSYWALAHAPNGHAPDFHHKDCFAARLRAPGDA